MFNILYSVGTHKIASQIIWQLLQMHAILYVSQSLNMSTTPLIFNTEVLYVYTDWVINILDQNFFFK